MKNKIALFVLLAVAVAQMGYAATTAGEKFKRGAEGFFTAPLEYSNEYHNAKTAQNGELQSWVSALFVGTFFGGKRVINGAYDMVTFPINYPASYGLLFKDQYDTALQEYNARPK